MRAVDEKKRPRRGTPPGTALSQPPEGEPELSLEGTAQADPESTPPVPCDSPPCRECPWWGEANELRQVYFAVSGEHPGNSDQVRDARWRYQAARERAKEQCPNWTRPRVNS